MSELIFNVLQTYSAIGLLVGAAIIMIDFIALKMGDAKNAMHPKGFVISVLVWPLGVGIILATIFNEIRRR